jgi:hypothetical protein
MSERDDGGPAFPVLHNDAGRVLIAENCGMTLRDYFAAKAMAAFLSNQETARIADKTHQKLDEMISRASYLQADAMLKARQQ